MNNLNASDPVGDARDKVKAPAIAIITAAVVTFLPYFGFAAVIIFNQLAGSGARETLGVVGNILFGIMILAIAGAYNGIIVRGGVAMLRLQDHKLAVTAAYMSIVPICSLGIGLPFGIWALITLKQEEVKSAFASE